ERELSRLFLSAALRHVVEPEVELDCANRALRMKWVSQVMIGPRQALTENELRVGDTLAVEQFVQIAHSDAIAARDRRGAELAIMEAGDDIVLDRSQPHCAHGSALGKRLAIAVGPKRQGD